MMTMKEKTDQQLLVEFTQQQSDGAFAELANRYQGMICATACRICGDASAAQDVLQQALIVLARRAKELTEVKSLGAWLHQVAVLESKKEVARAARLRAREQVAAQKQEEASGEEGDFAPVVDELLAGLAEKDRNVLVSHFLEGKTFKSVALAYGGTAEAWQKRSVRALQKLSQKLKGRGVVLPAGVLAGLLTTGRSEAGVSKTILSNATKTALGSTAGGGMSIGAMFLTMKTGILTSLLGGAVLSYGWNVNRAPEQENMLTGQNDVARYEIAGADSRQRFATSGGSQVSFLESLKASIESYDQLEARDWQLEARIKTRMFSVAEEDLEAVFSTLSVVQNKQRFEEPMMALFARWAEIDAAGAVARAGSAGPFAELARRGAMMTWLEKDHKAALAVMATEKSVQDKQSLLEYLRYKGERDPENAAFVVDDVADVWPEVDSETFPLVAELWSRRNGPAAGEWVATHPDEKLRRPLLRLMAGKVAKMRGFDGLKIADQIVDPAARAEARTHAIYWWSVSMAGHSLTEDRVRPNRDLSGGFPAHWSSEEVVTFSKALMVNYKQRVPDLLALARSEEQKIDMYKGIVIGASYTYSAYGAQAIEALPESVVDEPRMKGALEAYIMSWYKKDSREAEEWLTRQPLGRKTDVMWKKLGKEEKE